MQRRASGVVGAQIGRPGEAAECRPVALLRQEQFVGALDDGGDDVVLLVVEVAVVGLQIVEIRIGGPWIAGVYLFTKLPKWWLQYRHCR
jgi:hypothetical protein